MVKEIKEYKRAAKLYKVCAVCGVGMWCWLPNYLNMKVNNLITLNEKVIAQVWIKSIQIMCYDFYNIFYRKWEKEKWLKMK